MSCFLLDEMDPCDGDDDGLSQAASEFTSFSYHSETPLPYGTSVTAGHYRYNDHDSCCSYSNYGTNMYSSATQDYLLLLTTPAATTPTASYQPVPSAMMWSSYVEQLREVLSGFRTALEQVMDERSKRQGDMGLWRRSPNFSDELKLPTDFYKHICDNACGLVQGGCEYDRGLASHGAVIVQQSFVLGNATQKIMIIQELKQMAKRILYHESGGFVVSQILTEALTDKGMVTDALQFMAKAAHDADQCKDQKELIKSMRHGAANHSVRIWIELLGVQEKYEDRVADFDMHIDRWWTDIDGIVAAPDKHGFATHTGIISLAQNNPGYRCLIQMIRSFGNTTRLTRVTEQLVRPEGILLDLIKDQWGNFVITAMIEENIEMLTIIECMLKYFKHIRDHKYGNYPLQACIGSPHCDAHRMSFENLFTEWSKEDIAGKDKVFHEKISEKLRTSNTMAKKRAFEERQY